MAVALRRNRDVIAARLEIDSAELDVVAARIYPNPVFQYSAREPGARFTPTPRIRALTSRPGFFGQPVQSVGCRESDRRVGQAQRADARRRARASSARAWQTEDALARDRLRGPLGVRRRAARTGRAAAGPGGRRSLRRDRAPVAEAVRGGRHLRGRPAQDRARGSEVPERRDRRRHAARRRAHGRWRPCWRSPPGRALPPLLAPGSSAGPRSISSD